MPRDKHTSSRWLVFSLLLVVASTARATFLFEDDPPRGLPLHARGTPAARKAASDSPYHYQTYQEIVDALHAAQRDYPDLVSVFSANERFGLPKIGDCGANEPTPCEIWVAEVSSGVRTSSTTPTSSKAEVIISGELHGDERVGPQAVVALLGQLTQKYNSSDWIRRIVDRRKILLVPMTNAIGYHLSRRGEVYADGSEVDPNRDFAFNQEPSMCMVTVAARAINELFLSHLFRLMITFHGGTNVLGYEWGDFGHCEERGPCEPAPDHAGMEVLAKRMHDYAGSAGDYEEAYQTGDMGSTVYAVHGGMEDWAYGASWSSDVEKVTCTVANASSGGHGEVGQYPESKTTYSDGTHRCVTYLVETAYDKQPPEKTLGSNSEEVLLRDGRKNGHIPRNIRLALAAIDSVEPYVVLQNVSHNGQPPGHRSEAVSIDWLVGGGFHVDETWLQWSTEPGSDARAGATEHFSDPIPYPADSERKGAEFRQQLYLSSFLRDNKKLYFRIVAAVDGVLAKSPAILPPQSHFVNARNNEGWGPFANGKSKISGREFFTSETYKVTSLAPEFTYAVESDLTWTSKDGKGGLLSLTGAGAGDGYERPYLPKTGNVILVGLFLLGFASLVGSKMKKRYLETRSNAPLVTENDTDGLIANQQKREHSSPSVENETPV